MFSGVHATKDGTRSGAVSLASRTNEPSAVTITANRARLHRDEGRRLLRRTVPPLIGSQYGELIPRHNFESGSHGVMSRAAKFPANRLVFPRARKLKFRHADGAGQGFHSIIRAVEGERVHGVGAGDAEMDRNPGRNQDAVGNEQILLRNHAHGYRAIRVLLGAKIILDKLSREMKS